MAVGTVEEKIDALIHGKSELAALAVSAGENWITELGPDALRELLTLDPEATR
jgi:SNF2 family DNA or RNA helicase